MPRRTPPPPSPSLSPDDRIALGVIRKPHGVRGEASVEPWTDDPGRFSDLARVFLSSPEGNEMRTVTLIASRVHGDRVLVRFEEVGTPEEIRTLQGWTIEIPETEARPLEEGEYYLHDLTGLEVYEGARRIGIVRNAYSGGGGVLLSVERPDGGSFDIPFATAICTRVDLERGRLEVDLPEGIEDLEAIPAGEEGSLPGEASPGARPGPAAAPVLRVDVVTIFPAMFDAFLSEGVVARGVRSGVLDVRIHDLRDYTSDKHRSTDDEPYGGGAGMVMLAEPVFRCVEAIRGEAETRRPHVVMLSPQGEQFSQGGARDLAGRGWFVLLCGRYEGFDERIREGLVDQEVSVGDFVVSGGEVPAMLVLDAVSRMVEGVVGDRNSIEADSFYHGLLDHPHYTRPAVFRGMAVPDVLVSGHADNIRKWRKEQSLRVTRQKRPDLLEKASLDEEAASMLRRLEQEEDDGAGRTES